MNLGIGQQQRNVAPAVFRDALSGARQHRFRDVHGEHFATVADRLGEINRGGSGAAADFEQLSPGEIPDRASSSTLTGRTRRSTKPARPTQRGPATVFQYSCWAALLPVPSLIFATPG